MSLSENKHGCHEQFHINDFIKTKDFLSIIDKYKTLTSLCFAIVVPDNNQKFYLSDKDIKIFEPVFQFLETTEIDCSTVKIENITNESSVCIIPVNSNEALCFILVSGMIPISKKLRNEIYTNDKLGFFSDKKRLEDSLSLLQVSVNVCFKAYFDNQMLTAFSKKIKGLNTKLVHEKQKCILVEKDYRESESRYKKLTNATFEGIMIHDNGIIQDVNQVLCKMLGYEETELINEHIFKIIAETDRDHAKRYYNLYESSSYEIEFVKKDNNKISVEIHSKPFIYKSRTVRVVAVRDISERKQNEDKLRRRLKYEEELSYCSRKLMSGNEDVFNQTLKHLMLASNSSMIYLFENYTEKDGSLWARMKARAENVILTSEEQVPEYSKFPYSPVFDTWVEILKKGDHIHGHIDDFKNDIHHFFERLNVVSLLIIPVFVSGEWAGFIGFSETYKKRQWHNEDIRLLGTSADMIGARIARDKFEEALKNSEKRYRQLIEKMNEGLVILNKKGIITYVNPKMTQLFGYDTEKMLNHSPIDFLDNKDENNKKKFLESRKLLQNKPYEIEWLRADGSRMQTIVSPEQLTSDTGENIGTIAILTDITKIKQAEAELNDKNKQLERKIRELKFVQEKMHEARLDQQKFVSLVENSLDFIAIADLDMNIVYMNPGALKTIGIENFDYNINLVDDDSPLPEYKRKKIKDIFPKLKEKGYWRDTVKHINASTGQEFYMDSNSFYIYDPQTKKPLYIATVQRDITELKTTQKELDRKNKELNKKYDELKIAQEELIKAKEEQEKFFALVENSLDIITILDIEGNILYVNKTGREQILPEMKDKPLNVLNSDIIPVDQLKFNNEVIKPALHKNGFWNGEIQHMGQIDGKTKDVHMSIFVINDFISKQPKFYASIQRDITEQKRYERKLHEANDELIASEEELRQNAEELKANNENLERTKQKLEETLQNEKQIRQKLNIVINDLKQTQLQLVEKEKMASLGQLTAGIAHEINNPINFVSSNVNPLRLDLTDIKELLEKYRNIDINKDIDKQLSEINEFDEAIETDFLYEEIETLLNGIDEGAKRTKEIVIGLRNFSRLDENEFKRVDINESIDTTLMLLKNKIKNRINVHKNYCNEAEIECIPGKINQVFMNILTNATQAISEEGEIFITTICKTASIEIRIKDTGCGMTEEVKNRIFEPFFTTKDVGKGTGLGLSITYGIIEKHSGTIDVKSKAGEGSEFIITFPKNQVV